MQDNNMFKIFYDAISDEISIEKDLLERLGELNLSFTPLRSIKSLSLIKKYHINKFIYAFICLLFILFSPIYFLINMIRKIKYTFKEKNIVLKENIVLVANGRIEYLYKKIDISESTTTYININQLYKEDYIYINNFLSFKDYIKAYIYSIISVIYIFYKLKNKTNILQVYVAYNWFVVYIGLSKIEKKAENIYFANHYDRWAVMFDHIFHKKNLNLIQHGILPENLELSYKLKNINTIYAFDEHSRMIFKKIYNLKNTSYKELLLTLNLSPLNTLEKTILIIGQPYSTELEIEIIEAIKDRYKIYVKPHPLYDDSEYRLIDGIEVIFDRSFFPKVNMALAYDSTLGLEYEASGVKVLWWKDLNIEDIESKIIQGEK